VPATQSGMTETNPDSAALNAVHGNPPSPSLRAAVPFDRKSAVARRGACLSEVPARHARHPALSEWRWWGAIAGLSFSRRIARIAMFRSPAVVPRCRSSRVRERTGARALSCCKRSYGRTHSKVFGNGQPPRQEYVDRVLAQHEAAPRRASTDIKYSFPVNRVPRFGRKPEFLRARPGCRTEAGEVKYGAVGRRFISETSRESRRNTACCPVN